MENLSDPAKHETEVESAPSRESPPPGDASDTATGADALALAEAHRERDEYYDRLLRKTAEFENYRKRVERERRDLIDYAAADLLAELLPLFDDFERALAVEVEAASFDAYRQGVEIIHKQFLDLLRKRGVTPIAAVGVDFDPHLHQAVAYEASADHREGDVIEELRRGYRLGDRLLRPAMVKVAKA